MSVIKLTKIDILESLTQNHYSTEQFYAHGLTKYFRQLRSGEETLPILELMDIDEIYMFSFKIRDRHQRRIHD